MLWRKLGVLKLNEVFFELHSIAKEREKGKI